MIIVSSSSLLMVETSRAHRVDICLDCDDKLCLWLIFIHLKATEASSEPPGPEPGGNLGAPVCSLQINLVSFTSRLTNIISSQCFHFSCFQHVDIVQFMYV